MASEDPVLQGRPALHRSLSARKNMKLQKPASRKSKSCIYVTFNVFKIEK